MGRSAEDRDSLDEHPQLFPEPDLPAFPVTPEIRHRGLQHPLWTQRKALLIQRYMYLFIMVTHSGAYIDGFAAPQRRNRVDLCSAELVLSTEPKWITKFWLCDESQEGVSLLRGMADRHAARGRKIEVVHGDFNSKIDGILAGITNKTATFALLDQRTFECDWSTVAKIARHRAGPKIEIFYFLATGWFERAVAAVRRPETIAQIERWWGRPDWQTLRQVGGIERARMFVARFREELGYSYVQPYAIYSRPRGGSVMYYMIHATDHPAAPGLMVRAYRQISGRNDPDELYQQIDLERLWDQSQEDVPVGSSS